MRLRLTHFDRFENASKEKMESMLDVSDTLLIL
jgi:hypothetical protein